MNERSVPSQSSEAYYRAYFVGEDNKIEHAAEVIARCDEDAALQAQQLVNGKEVEVWCHGRFVVRLRSRSLKNGFA